MVFLRSRQAVAFLMLAATGCGAAPPPPPLAAPPDEPGPAGDPWRVLTSSVARDGEAMSELATAQGVPRCGTRGQPYVDCSAALIGAAARSGALDSGTKALFQAFARPQAWVAGPAGPRALAEAMQSAGPASDAADAILVACGGIVLQALDSAPEAGRALLFARGIGLPCPDLMRRLDRVAPEGRRAALVEAACIAGGEDALTEDPDGLAARSALEVLDGARRRLRAAGGAMSDALLPTFEQQMRTLRIPIPLATTLSVRGSTLMLPEVSGGIEWAPPVAILTIVGDGTYLGEPPWLGLGPQGPTRLGTVLPGPRTTPEALADDLVQVRAAIPPGPSGSAASGPVLVVADARQSAQRVGAVLAHLTALPGAPPVALAVNAGGRQAQVDFGDTRDLETPVGLRLVLGEHSSMVIAAGVGLPADRDVGSLVRRLDEIRATYPDERIITLVLGADVSVARLAQVLQLASARRFQAFRIATQ